MRLEDKFKLVARYCGMGIALLGSVVLLGWILDIPVLKSVLPSLVTMKTNTAIGFILSGLSLYLFITKQSSRRALYVSRICALIVLFIGLLTLSEYLFGWNLGIDQLLFKESAGAIGTLSPNRMAPTTAFDFLIFGLAMLILDTRADFNISQALSVIGGLLGLIGLVGYIYGVREFFGIAKYTQMAVHTAVAFFVLGLGVLFSRPNKGLMSIITGESFGSRIARRLFPYVFILPIILGWLRLTGDRLGLYSLAYGVVLMMVSYMVIFGVIVLWNAKSLNKIDAERNQAAIESSSLADIIQSSNDAIISKTLEGIILSWNKGAERIYGYTEGEVKGKHLSFLVGPQRKNEIMDIIQKIRRGGRVEHFETKRICKDGREIDVSLSVSAIINGGGEIIGVSAIARDITEHKILDNKIKFAAAEWRKTFDSITDLIFVQDKDYNIIRLNKAMADALKMEIKDVLGKKCYELLHKSDKPWPQCPFSQTLLDKMMHTQEVNDPNIGIPLSVSTSPIFNDQGEFVGSVHIARDISQIKKVEQELKDKVSELERFNKVAVGRELKMIELKKQIEQLTNAQTNKT